MTITELGMTTVTANEPGIYHDALAGLRHATSGEGRALLLEAMAAEADRAAAAARGIVPADSRNSSLAWEMTAVLLRQLAAAQRGLILHMVGDYDAERWDAGRDWEDVARASTSREFTAAFAIVYGELLDDLQYQDEAERAAAIDTDPGDPATPALAQLAVAARANSDGDWWPPLTGTGGPPIMHPAHRPASSSHQRTQAHCKASPVAGTFTAGAPLSGTCQNRQRAPAREGW